VKVTFLLTGKTSKSFVKEHMETLVKRISRYCEFELIELKTERYSNSLPVKEIKKKEAKLILNKITTKDFVIALDENGKQYSSRNFAETLEKYSLTSQRIIFLVGGAFGYDPTVLDRSNAKLSLSSMTFSHQLIRIIFLEQLYRAFTILNNEKYHND